MPWCADRLGPRSRCRLYPQALSRRDQGSQALTFKGLQAMARAYAWVLLADGIAGRAGSFARRYRLASQPATICSTSRAAGVHLSFSRARIDALTGEMRAVRLPRSATHDANGPTALPIPENVGELMVAHAQSGLRSGPTISTPISTRSVGLWERTFTFLRPDECNASCEGRGRGESQIWFRGLAFFQNSPVHDFPWPAFGTWPHRLGSWRIHQSWPERTRPIQ